MWIDNRHHNSTNFVHAYIYDGKEKPILTANRMLPGPSIQVCKSDTIGEDVDHLFEVTLIENRASADVWHLYKVILKTVNCHYVR